jgi:hypothetical protein
MAEAQEAFNFKVSVNKFDGTDFTLWKNKITSALKASRLWEAVNDGFDTDVEGNAEKDEKAKVIMMTSITDSILRKLPFTSAKAMWKALMKRFEDKSTQNVIFLLQRFMNHRQDEEESVENFTDRVVQARENLAALDQELADSQVILTIMQGLRQEYENVAQFLLMNKKLDELDAEELIESLKIEERRRLEKKQSSQTQGSTQAFYSNKKTFKKKKNSKDVKCYNCDKMGHFAKDCRAPKRERKSKSQEEKKTYTAKEERKKEFAFHMKNLDTKGKEIW